MLPVQQHSLCALQSESVLSEDFMGSIPHSTPPRRHTLSCISLQLRFTHILYKCFPQRKTPLQTVKTSGLPESARGSCWAGSQPQGQHCKTVLLGTRGPPSPHGRPPHTSLGPQQALQPIHKSSEGQEAVKLWEVPSISMNEALLIASPSSMSRPPSSPRNGSQTCLAQVSLCSL